MAQIAQQDHLILYATAEDVGTKIESAIKAGTIADVIFDFGDGRMSKVLAWLIQDEDFVVFYVDPSNGEISNFFEREPPVK